MTRRSSSTRKAPDLPPAGQPSADITSAPARHPAEDHAGHAGLAEPRRPVEPLRSAEPLRPGSPPLAFLIDYDGTIALTDVSDTIMAEHVPGEWEDLAAAYDAGRMGSRRLMEAEIALIRTDDDGAAIRATALAQPHDPGFVPFVRRAQSAGIPVEVVSDGYGFFIGPALERLGVPELPVFTATTTFANGGARITFPNGHPRCFVCGTCKRERVLAQQRAGRAVAFIGDGTSDRYAAGYAEVIFAKRALVPICLAAGWPFRRWTEFAEIEQWLAETLAAWHSGDAAELLPAPTRKPFFCGPEVWGDGRIDPPPSSWPQSDPDV